MAVILNFGKILKSHAHLHIVENAILNLYNLWINIFEFLRPQKIWGWSVAAILNFS